MFDRAAPCDMSPRRATFPETSTRIAVLLGLLVAAVPLASSCGRARQAASHGPAAAPAGGAALPSVTPASTAAQAKVSTTTATPPLAAAATPPPRGQQIVIAYSSNLLGEYEPCG